MSAFHEKPDRVTAERYLSDGRYFWNGGMFLFSASVFLQELKRLEPAMHELSARAVRTARRDIDFLRLDADAFRQCRHVSIDYAVMEKSDRVAMVPLDAGWDDVGSWRFLERLEADPEGNRARGDVLLEDARNNTVYSSGRLVALLGTDDQVVVETQDAVLVAGRDQVPNVGKLVEQLRRAGRDVADSLPQTHRPWGHYETIAQGPRFQVKRITVKPGHSLSLQMHHHRAEHWVVVRGTARVSCNDREFLLSEDQSTYIPIGAHHRLQNPGRVPLELIEVQSGKYLGEDDIVRFEDHYGRKGEES